MAKQILGNSDTQIIADTVTLSHDPSASKQAATKAYVDAMSDRTYIHYQMTASNRWLVNHGLNKRPSVAVVDTAETVYIGEIEYVDNNNIILTFSYPFSGKAYLN